MVLCFIVCTGHLEQFRGITQFHGIRIRLIPGNGPKSSFFSCFVICFVIHVWEDYQCMEVHADQIMVLIRTCFDLFCYTCSGRLPMHGGTC